MWYVGEGSQTHDIRVGHFEGGPEVVGLVFKRLRYFEFIELLGLGVSFTQPPRRACAQIYVSHMILKSIQNVPIPIL